ncbi:MAG TPA: hypothetical protein VNS81_02825 [Nocardioides sp.]|nr:hypothetical protein [Nocardioides sp.]
MNATWLAIVTGFGALLWLATDHFVFFVVAAMLGLAVGLGAGSEDHQRS